MPVAKKDKVKILSSNVFPVVGVGASAGGLDAFKSLIKAIPERSGMAYILVQHLDPAHDSILSALLQKVTKIPISEITDNVHVEADHIYIIPSNKLLTATDGILQLSARLPRGEKNMPIDVFFTSLAEVHQNHAIGVVLSGNGSDGTLGLKKIKEHEGITFAQDPDSASHNSMPKSAIDAGVVDFVLSPDKLPDQLRNLGKSLKILPYTHEEKTAKKEEDEYKQILALLQHKRNVDFTHYKQTTIRRRIDRRVVMSQKGGIKEYIKALKDSETEQDVLFHDLLIPVTEFFRDNEVFEKICNKVFPLLLKDRKEDDQLRIWVAGCSTGEEAYSLVICLKEYLEANDLSPNIQLFATDISEKAITKARSGIYTKADVATVSPARLNRFFTRKDGNYRLHKSIRDSCVFALHNFLNDPPFAKMDLITCRNALIYLQPSLQKNALTTFHYALKENGLLILGKSETTAQAGNLYNAFDKVNKIYRRKAVKGNFLHVIPQRKTELRKHNSFHPAKTEPARNDFQKIADELLLSRYAPPGVVVNSELDIVQFRGPTAIWLEPSPGKPNLNVLKMVRQDLSFELRNALYKTQKDKEPTIKENIPIRVSGKLRNIRIEVIPLHHTETPHFLVLFVDTTPTANGNGEGKITVPSSKEQNDRRIIQQLQQELAQTREDMRSITEDQEAYNEELQSANEELLSGSEELQSLNEELENSKEEIQTSNEELITVNQELKDRNEQLNLSRLYAESIVNTIREPLIILDKDLKVISANRAYYSKFQATEAETEDKVFFHLGKKEWNIPRLRKMLQELLPSKTSISDFEIVRNFPAFGERILLINATQVFSEISHDKSILMAIEDVTDKRKTEEKLKSFAEELEHEVSERTLSLKEAITDLKNSNKSLEQFAYIASHDLQEPLRKIRTFSNLLETKYKANPDKDANELVSKINSAAERMSTLIKGVLNFSKILNTDTPFIDVDLNLILSEVIDDFELLIKEKKVVIHRMKLPVILGVPFQMSQLFTNLLSNSIKFSRKSVNPVISISSALLTKAQVKKQKNLSPDFSYCRITFKDNGIGFDQKFADHIFLIFQRLHGQREYSGTGIGLALCKSIVSLHHGEITAVSKPNKGTTFFITLPLPKAK